MTVDLNCLPIRAVVISGTRPGAIKMAPVVRALQVNGWAWVEEHYAWQTVYQQVDQVQDGLLGAAGGHG